MIQAAQEADLYAEIRIDWNAPLILYLIPAGPILQMCCVEFLLILHLMLIAIWMSRKSSCVLYMFGNRKKYMRWFLVLQ